MSCSLQRRCRRVLLRRVVFGAEKRCGLRASFPLDHNDHQPTDKPHKTGPTCRLDPCSGAHAAYCDARGVLTYLHFDAGGVGAGGLSSRGGTVTELARFALARVPADADSAGGAGGPRPARRLGSGWAAFGFVPGRPGEVVAARRGSGRLLYAPLPRAPGAGCDAFLFGEHAAPLTCLALSPEIGRAHV